MKKLVLKRSRLNFGELKEKMEAVRREEQRGYVGGGNGTASSPYTWDEFEGIDNDGLWKGGYVQNASGCGYTYMSGTVACSADSTTAYTFSGVTNGYGNSGFLNNYAYSGTASIKMGSYTLGLAFIMLLGTIPRVSAPLSVFIKTGNWFRPKT